MIEQLEGIRRRCEKASGPIHYGPVPKEEEPDTWLIGSQGLLFCRVVGRPDRPAENDARFFANAKTDVLILLAEVARLQGLLSEVSPALDKMLSNCQVLRIQQVQATQDWSVVLKNLADEAWAQVNKAHKEITEKLGGTDV